MSLQITPTKDQYQAARMQADYDKLDIRAREAMNRLNRSTTSNLSGRRSITRTAGTVRIAKIDYDVTLRSIERERERLDLKYGNDKFAQLNITPKEREQLANIQQKYDQLSNREDQLHAEGQKEHTHNITNVFEGRRRIGTVLDQTTNNAESRDIRLETIQRERERLDILYGGEPKAQHLHHAAPSLSPTQAPAPAASIGIDRRAVKEISLDELSRLSRDMKESAHMSQAEKINKFNGVGESTLNDNTLKHQSPALEEKTGIGIRF